MKKKSDKKRLDTDHTRCPQSPGAPDTAVGSECPTCRGSAPPRRCSSGGKDIIHMYIHVH